MPAGESAERNPTAISPTNSSPLLYRQSATGMDPPTHDARSVGGIPETEQPVNPPEENADGVDIENVVNSISHLLPDIPDPRYLRYQSN